MTSEADTFLLKNLIPALAGTDGFRIVKKATALFLARETLEFWAKRMSDREKFLFSMKNRWIFGVREKERGQVYTFTSSGPF
jgi:hypothetical protein